jgi:hypothetical protein
MHSDHLLTMRLVYLLTYAFYLVFGQTSTNDTSIRMPSPKPINMAFCLTGQLARLELSSKIRNIFIPNAELGHNVHIFILLDSEVDKIKQTFWKFDYSDSPFLQYDRERLERYLADKVAPYPTAQQHIKYWIRLESPVQAHYQVVGNMIPVSDKIIRRPNKKMGGEMPEVGQTHMSIHLLALRSRCVCVGRN